MLRGGGGSLINTSSVNGLVAEPFLTIYATSKGAIIMLSKGIALDYAKQGIRCNAIAPGLIATDSADAMVSFHGDRIVKSIPLRRMGSADEVAQLAVYLASDDAAWVTGEIYRIDGGQG
jgi:dihydroanticapsin dehydrogenase